MKTQIVFTSNKYSSTHGYDIRVERLVDIMSPSNITFKDMPTN